MRIGVIYLGRRGSGGLLALEVARNFPADVEGFLVASAQAGLRPQIERSGVPHLLADVVRSDLQALWSLADTRRARKLAGEIGARRPDALFFPMLHPWNWIIQDELRQIPSLVMVHDPLPHPGLRDRFFSFLQGLSIRRAARCAVLSRVFVQELGRFDIPPERVDVIPHGILEVAAGPAPSPAPDPWRLLFFGRIEPYKGLEVLLPAFRRVLRRFPQARLWVVGEGRLRPYRSLMDGLPNLHVVNRWVDDAEAAAAFAESGLVVLPYTSATQSGVIAQAAAFDLPVIATHTGGLPEQLAGGEAGVLVRPGSVDELAAAIEELLANPERARELGRRLGCLFREERSWAKIASLVSQSCRLAMNA